MVLASAIIAVALGMTPVLENEGGQVVQLDQAAFSREIGRYRESTDPAGVRHLRGFDQYGRPYSATVDAKGHVDFDLAGRVIEFTIAEAN